MNSAQRPHKDSKDRLDIWEKGSEYYYLFRDAHLEIIQAGLKKSTIRYKMVGTSFVVIIIIVLVVTTRFVPRLLTTFSAIFTRYDEVAFELDLFILFGVSFLFVLHAWISSIKVWLKLGPGIKGKRIPIKVKLWLLIDRSVVAAIEGNSNTRSRNFLLRLDSALISYDLMNPINVRSFYFIVLTDIPLEITEDVLIYRPFSKNQTSLLLTINTTYTLTVGDKMVTFVLQCTDPNGLKPPQVPKNLYVYIKDPSLLEKSAESAAVPTS